MLTIVGRAAVTVSVREMPASGVELPANSESSREDVATAAAAAGEAVALAAGAGQEEASARRKGRRMGAQGNTGEQGGSRGAVQGCRGAGDRRG